MLGQEANSQVGATRPTKVPSGHTMASMVQTLSMLLVLISSFENVKVDALISMTAPVRIPKTIAVIAPVKITLASFFMLSILTFRNDVPFIYALVSASSSFSKISRGFR
jgi:hypothetical protein